MIEIPKERRKAQRQEPRSILIYGSYKSGKSAIAAQLPNSLLIEMEEGGADNLEGRILELTSLKEINKLTEVFEKVKKMDDIKFIILDTATAMDEASEIIGTYNFMKKAQGKNFNVIDGKRLNHLDPRFETVNELPNGFGYRYSREVMDKWYRAAIATGKTVIFIAHIKDKLISTKSGDLVEVADLNLTGKVKQMYASRVDALAYLVREGDNSYLSFQSIGEVAAGSRYPYLNDKILIGEGKNGALVKTHWESIFPSIKKD